MKSPSLKATLKIKYNTFVLQTLVALSFPIGILSLSATSNFLFFKYIALLVFSIFVEIVIFLFKKHKSLELSSAFNTGFLILLLPLDASFFICFLSGVFMLIFKYMQGGFGKNIFNPAFLSIVLLYFLFPDSFVYKNIEEDILIFLFAISWIGVFILLIWRNFFNYLVIASFAGGIFLYAFFDFFVGLKLDILLFKSFLNQGGLLFLTAILAFCEPSLGLVNKHLSFLIGLIVGFFTALFANFLPLNQAFLIGFLIANFWKYPITEFVRKPTGDSGIK